MNIFGRAVPGVSHANGDRGLIAGSPPISLSLIVGESKWDAKASGTRKQVGRESKWDAKASGTRKQVGRESKWDAPVFFSFTM